ncbi:hypothetical protein PV325_013287 [Microctonus aethiopoides]|nr:hypothetical protein PV325_013287 [Microctonus aethiopoides]
MASSYELNGCTNNTQCLKTQYCLTEVCRNPCPGSCGIDASCHVINHTLSCICPDCYEGDAYEQCTPLQKKQKCKENKDCSKIHQCINKECNNPCPGSCGIEALCYVTNQTISCECPRCYGGNPYEKCATRLAYIIMCNVASSGITLCRFLENRASNILPYKIYLPYNYTKPFLYRFTVLLQSSTLFIAGNVAAGFDTLFFGVMLQIISKINILKHRFQVTVMTLVEIHDKKSCYIKDYNKIEDTFLTIWIKSHKAIIR